MDAAVLHLRWMVTRFGASPIFGGKPPYLLVQGEGRAGAPFAEKCGHNAVRIFTGAVIPGDATRW